MKEIRFLLDKLESVDFSVRVNVASDLDTVRRIVVSDPVVRQVITLCQDGEIARGILADNVRRLASKGVDPRYESPWDIAMTAQLMILVELNDALQVPVAQIVRKAPQTWWASKEAAEVLAAEWSKASSENVYAVVTTLAGSFPKGQGMRVLLNSAPEYSINDNVSSEPLILSEPTVVSWHIWPARPLPHPTTGVLIASSYCPTIAGEWQRAELELITNTDTRDQLGRLAGVAK